jgi:hypothetical protein
MAEQLRSDVDVLKATVQQRAQQSSEIAELQIKTTELAGSIARADVAFRSAAIGSESHQTEAALHAEIMAQLWEDLRDLQQRNERLPCSTSLFGGVKDASLSNINGAFAPLKCDYNDLHYRVDELHKSLRQELMSSMDSFRQDIKQRSTSVDECVGALVSEMRSDVYGAIATVQRDLRSLMQAQGLQGSDQAAVKDKESIQHVDIDGDKVDSPLALTKNGNCPKESPLSCDRSEITIAPDLQDALDMLVEKISHVKADIGFIAPDEARSNAFRCALGSTAVVKQAFGRDSPRSQSTSNMLSGTPSAPDDSMKQPVVVPSTKVGANLDRRAPIAHQRAIVPVCLGERVRSLSPVGPMSTNTGNEQLPMASFSGSDVESTRGSRQVSAMPETRRIQLVSTTVPLSSRAHSPTAPPLTAERFECRSPRLPSVPRMSSVPRTIASPSPSGSVLTPVAEPLSRDNHSRSILANPKPSRQSSRDPGVGERWRSC